MSQNNNIYSRKTDATIGIDIGGTKVNLGLITSDGRIYKKQRYPFIQEDICEFTVDLIQRLADFIADERDKLNIIGMGIGIKGLVNFTQQKLVYSSIFKDSADFDMRNKFEEEFHLPVVIENDVKAATLAEARFGVGKKHKNFIFINIGTGLSIGVIDEGRLIRGKDNYSGEFGRILFTSLEENTHFKNLESIASGKGLENEINQKITEYSGNRNQLGAGIEKERISSWEIFDEYQKGDQLARIVIENALHHLAVSIINLEFIFDSQCYVFGGGVIDNRWFLTQLREKIITYSKSLKIPWNASLLLSELGANDIGVIGAACAFFDRNNFII